MEEEKKEEFELEGDFDGSRPVEIHPEMYSSDLFGKPPAKEITESFSLSTGAPTASESLSPAAKSPFNIFALTDAIGARKKRDAWVLYQKALASGMVAEEVFYKLVWHVRTMLIAKKTRSAEEADMKPFPYSKAKGFLKNFNEGELEKLSERLVVGYHVARRGDGEIETFVEKTLLSL